MAERLETGIEKLLVGAAIEEDSPPIIDYTIGDQHKSMGKIFNLGREVEKINMWQINCICLN